MAIDLAWRGIPSTLVERRDGSISLPKMNAVNIRTMEMCRRWGLSERVEKAGFPKHLPRRMQYVTRLRDEPMHVIDYGAPSEGGARSPNVLTNSPERYQRCPQTWFDPILRDHAASFPGNRLLYDTEMERFEDRGDHVRATLVDRASGARREIAAEYMVACDGAKSGVRDALGITMAGSMLSYEINVYFESDAVFRPGERISVLSWLIGPNGLWGGLSAIDGRRLYRLWLTQMPQDTDLEKFDGARYVREAVGEDIPFEVVGILPWLRQQRVANEFRKGRVFLCGDALHNLTPTGGFGMNTGILDAIDLSWKLEAVRAGWAPERLLDTYKIERRPVAERNVNEATYTFANILRLPKLPELCDATPAGAAAREKVGRHIVEHQFEREFKNEGIVMGYRYDPSPIVVPDGTPAPPDTPMTYTQTARPGSRAPHATLADGRSTLDLFGRGFALLRMGPEAPSVDAFVDAARARKVPLTVTAIPEPAVRALYEQPLAIVRPDGHVAWRGAVVPADPLAVIDTIRGARM